MVLRSQRKDRPPQVGPFIALHREFIDAGFFFAIGVHLFDTRRE